MKKLPPVHPGEVLAEEYMIPLNLSANALGRAIGVPPNRLSDIVRGKRSITADTALRLARYFGTSAQLWMGLQSKYDLDTASDANAARIEREVPQRATA